MYDFTEEDLEAAPVIPFSMGNCTVVSILPYPIKESKPSIIPGYFQIPRCKDPGKPSVLPVGESIHWVESPFKGNVPPMKLTHSPKEVARSIVNDLIEGQLGLDSDAMPGLFWVEGHWSSEEIVFKHYNKLEEADNRQTKWFSVLVRIADDDWSKYKQHKFVSDLQRYAARAMGLQREWLTAVIDEINIQCPLCKGFVRPDAIVHSECGFVMKPIEYNQFKKDGRILEVTQ